jgi:hypothetical protein
MVRTDIQRGHSRAQQSFHKTKFGPFETLLYQPMV